MFLRWDTIFVITNEISYFFLDLEPQLHNAPELWHGTAFPFAIRMSHDIFHIMLLGDWEEKKSLLMWPWQIEVIAEYQSSNNMEYPSLSLKQASIDKSFSKIQDDFKVTPSPGAIRVKEYHQKKKELLLQSPVLEECDKCGFKTSKYLAM